jgi:hypothetical protein
MYVLVTIGCTFILGVRWTKQHRLMFNPSFPRWLWSSTLTQDSRRLASLLGTPLQS